ncbi:DUF6986 family protein [Sciscionella sediminilitoris]|uniref:DUF6986 family protein n=1 Tax=Sciscionella sediminilitoris TaxID=1445613 RepID=UPI0004DF6FE0|nr:aldolase/citrate lyase family protein [Sciscionella sp. SE31]
MHIDANVLAEIERNLEPVDAAFARMYPGERRERQPVHTVYVPADRFGARLCREWGDRAIRALAEFGPDPDGFAAASGIDPVLAGELYPRVRAKLAAEPIEDLRIDFEDGYLGHSAEQEYATARHAAAELGTAIADGSAPAFHGIRIKSLEAATRQRGIRTLDTFLAALLATTTLPEGFVVTLPKVTAVEQVEAMLALCAGLERAHGLDNGSLRFEIQVETPQTVLGADGTAPIARMVHVAGNRCAGLHYGTYDYSAACGIAAEHQSMEHAVADHAKAVMQLAVAGTGVRLSDGSTNILPVGTAEQVHHAWRLHTRLVGRSLERGFYQGWDLHPAQLPTRFAATYAFFRAGFPAAADRLRRYLEHAAGGVLDEPATARALSGFLLRGLDCGAIDPAELSTATGRTRADLEALNP